LPRRRTRFSRFAYATDLRNAPGRIKAITKLDVLTDGEVRLGTRFRETRA